MLHNALCSLDFLKSYKMKKVKILGLVVCSRAKLFLCAKGGRGKIFHGKGKLLEAFTVKFTKIKTVLHLQTKKKN